MLHLLRKYKLYVALVLIATIFFIVMRVISDSQTVQTTYTLTTGPISQTVTTSGNVSSAGTLDIYASTNGVITEYYVDNGQTIEADTPMFKITSTATEQERAAAKAAYLTSIDEYNVAEQNKILYQAQLEEARTGVLEKSEGVDNYINETTDQSDYDRDIAYSEDWSTRKRFDNAEKKYLDSQQTLAAKSQSISAKKAVYDATLDQVVKSTVAGTVANIQPQVGDEVFIISHTKSEPILSLSNFDTYTVEVNVSENDIFRIKLGQQATVVIESFPDNTLEGTVSKVDTIGEVDNGLVTYTVTIELHDIDIRMRAGMTAEVKIMTDAQPQALLVPNAALSQGANGKVVYVQNGTGYVEKPVQIGIKNAEYSEVLSGLMGSEVLLDPLEITNNTAP